MCKASMQMGLSRAQSRFIVPQPNYHTCIIQAHQDIQINYKQLILTSTITTLVCIHPSTTTVLTNVQHFPRPHARCSHAIRPLLEKFFKNIFEINMKIIFLLEKTTTTRLHPLHPPSCPFFTCRSHSTMSI
jgi:hypothetical protein